MRRERSTYRNVPLAAALAGALLLTACASSTPRGAGGDGMQTSAIAQRSINAAQTLLDAGKFDEALAESKAALDADPRSAEAHVVHGAALDGLGRGIEAGEHYQRAVSLAPDSGAVLNARGAWLCRSGRVDEALAAFSKATMDERFRQPEQALANAGSCAAGAQRAEVAELNFRAALALSPSLAQALGGMARLEHQRGNALGARAFLQRREAVGPLGAADLALGIEIETAAGDARAAARYREQLAAMARDAEAAASNTIEPGSSRQ